MTLQRGLLVGGLISGGFLFFFVLSKLGEKLIKSEEKFLKVSTDEEDNLEV